MYEHEQRQAWKQIAERVATHLHSKLARKLITTINIDTIRAELLQQTECPRDAAQFDALEELTTRRVVEKAG